MELATPMVNGHIITGYLGLYPGWPGQLLWYQNGLVLPWHRHTAGALLVVVLASLLNEKEVK